MIFEVLRIPNVGIGLICEYFLCLSIQALTSTAVKKGGFSTGDVAAQYKHKNSIIDVKVDTESNVGCFVT